MSFSIDIAKFANKTQSTVSEAARAIKIELFTSVIMDTRVDTGRLRGNWQTTTGSPNTGATERLDPSGNQASSEAQSNVTPYGVDYLANNLPYAEVWEEKDGMVVKNMARIERIVKKAARDVKG